MDFDCIARFYIKVEILCGYIMLLYLDVYPACCTIVHRKKSGIIFHTDYNIILSYSIIYSNRSYQTVDTSWISSRLVS